MSDPHTASTVPPPVSPRDVISAAITEGAMLRLHIRELQLSWSGSSSTVEARPLALMRGRDGRERVVLAIVEGDDPVERRVPLERVIRTEWLLALPEAQARSVSGVVRRTVEASHDADGTAATMRPPEAERAVAGRR